MNIDTLWEYSDPGASEARFRTQLETAPADERLELLTQIARTYSLRRRFAEAHAVLDEVEPQLAAAGPRPGIRYYLERGRTFNSSGYKDQARPLFEQAWTAAEAAGEEGLAVDAAHMVAIVLSGDPEGLEWGRRGLELARRSLDQKAQALIPALLNNLAWDLHDLGRYTEALPVFEEAEVEWSQRGRQMQIRIARWSVARCLRSLGRYAEALTIQRQLEAEYQADGEANGDVFEEIAVNLAALGEDDEAKSYLDKAKSTRGEDD